MLIKDNGKTIQIRINDPEDDVSTGMKIKGGVFPDKVIVIQRQNDGTSIFVEYFKEQK